MKDEYKQTNYYKQKTADLKLNRLMGRIKKNARGPNPLSNLKKKPIISNESKNNSNINNSSENNIVIKEKRKRVRNRKNKLQLNIN